MIVFRCVADMDTNDRNKKRLILGLSGFIIVMVIIAAAPGIFFLGEIVKPEGDNPRSAEENTSATSEIRIGFPERTVVVASSRYKTMPAGDPDYVCDGVDDQIEISQALDSLAGEGGTVLLTDGTFNCSGILRPHAETTLRGSGSGGTLLNFSNDGRIQVEAESVTIGDFSMKGMGYSSSAMWYSLILIRASNTTVRNVTGTADHTVQAVFQILGGDTGVYRREIRNVTFRNCSALYPRCGGFYLTAWGNDNKTIRNVTFIDCQAIGCATGYPRFGEYDVGFDFAELNDIENLTVTGCSAEGCWESGFHFEYDRVKKNCVLIDCVSTNNGRKPYPQDRSIQYFGAGYYAPEGDVTFINCTSEANSQYGFFSTDGGKLYGCVDRSCGEGASSAGRQPTSFYGVSTDSPGASLVLEDCWSIDSRGYAFWIDDAMHVRVDNFTMIGTAGIDDVGAVLGAAFGGCQYCSVGMNASECQSSTILHIEDGRDSLVTGRFVTDSPHALVVSGSKTSGLKIRGVTVVSNTLPQGSTGIAIHQSVPDGAVTIEDCRVLPVDKSVGASLWGVATQIAGCVQGILP